MPRTYDQKCKIREVLLNRGEKGLRMPCLIGQNGESTFNRQDSVIGFTNLYLRKNALSCMARKTKKKVAISCESHDWIPESKSETRKTAWDVAKEWQNLGKGKIEKLKLEEASTT